MNLVHEPNSGAILTEVPAIELKSSDMSKDPIREWLDLWHQLLDDPSIPPFQDPEELIGVLADLRRKPDHLAKAFAPVPRGNELLKRVKLCVDAEPNHEGVYLVPQAVEATDEQLRELVVDAIARGYRCCGDVAPEYAINILRRSMTNEEACRSAPLVEGLGVLFIKFRYESDSLECKAMQFLSEALYTLATSFEVQGYCLTPLCPDEIRRIDPYEPQLALWLRGAQAVVRWNDGGREAWVDVFVQP